MTDKKPRIWDDDCVDSDADGDITAKDAARKGLEAAQHARWMRKFGPNYMMVVESRRAKRKRAGRQEGPRRRAEPKTERGADVRHLRQRAYNCRGAEGAQSARSFPATKAKEGRRQEEDRDMGQAR